MLWSCSRGDVDARIFRAEALVDSFPDSALAIMRTVDSTGLRGERERAMYALTLTRAEDRNYIDRTDDSLIAIAVRYFDRHDDPRRRMFSYFYYGAIARNREDYGEALLRYLKASKFVNEENSHLEKGLLYRNLSDIFKASWNGSEAVRFGRMALEEFKKEGSRLHEEYARLNLAECLSNNMRYRESLALLDSISSLTPFDAELYCESMRAKAVSFAGLDDNEKVVQLLFEIAQIDSLTRNDRELLSLAFIRIGKLTAARDILKEDNTGAIEGYFLAYLDDDFKEDDEIVNMLSSELKRYNDILRSIQNSDLPGAMNNYTVYEDTIHKQEIREKNFKIMITIVFMLVVVAMSLFVVYLYRRSQTLKMEKVILQAEAMSVELRTKDERIEEIIRNQFQEMNQLLDVYYQHKDNPKIGLLISKELDNTLKSFSPDSTYLTKVENSIDRDCANLISNFYASFPGISNNEKKLFLFIVMGLSTRAMCLLFDIQNPNALSARRMRLKKKIAESNIVGKERFLRYF